MHIRKHLKNLDSTADLGLFLLLPLTLISLTFALNCISFFQMYQDSLLFKRPNSHIVLSYGFRGPTITYTGSDLGLKINPLQKKLLYLYYAKQIQLMKISVEKKKN